MSNQESHFFVCIRGGEGNRKIKKRYKTYEAAVSAAKHQMLSTPTKEPIYIMATVGIVSIPDYQLDVHKVSVPFASNPVNQPSPVDFDSEISRFVKLCGERGIECTLSKKVSTKRIESSDAYQGNVGNLVTNEPSQQ